MLLKPCVITEILLQREIFSMVFYFEFFLGFSGFSGTNGKRKKRKRKRMSAPSKES